tara:strand:+ start:96 stop:509 length:414 start_codon:yes stop_codon:yes gene_type:complete
MIDEIYSAFVSELEKIAVEAETGKDDQSADVDSEREVSPAVDKIFRMTDLTRITQSKDETGKPGASAHGSPALTTREAAKKIHEVGVSDGYRRGAKEGVEIAGQVGKKAYESGYSNAAKKGVEEAGKAYLRGRNEQS